MKFVVDGPDGAGKNLLCSILKAHTGYEIVHLSHNNFTRPYDLDFYKILLQKDKVIFNRFFFSELVYSRIKNRQCDLSKDCMKLLLNLMAKDTVILHVTNRYDVLKQRLQTRGDSFINSQELKTAKESYDLLMGDLDGVSTIYLDLPMQAAVNLGVEDA